MKWPRVHLGSHCSKIGSGSTPRGGEQVYQPQGTAFLRSQNIYNGLFQPQGLAFLAESEAEGLAGVTVRSADVLLNITGDSVARCCIVPDAILPARVSQHVAIIRPDPSAVDARFLMYFLVSPGMQALMLSLAGSGGTRKALTKEMIERFQVPKPPMPVQRRIASILSAYDDLMENNRRRMGLLEEAARQLYREWFVRLRFPGHQRTKTTSGLPPGWHCVSIAEVADCVGGGTPSTNVPSYWQDGDVTWVTPTDVTRNKHLVLLDSEKQITREGLKNSSAKLVPPHAILMTSRASVGFFAIASREVCTNQGFISVVAHQPVSTPYLLFHLSERAEEIRGMGTGSTYPEVSRGKFRTFQITLPPASLLSAFDQHSSPTLEQIKVLKQQNHHLHYARDLLLPRLMSGEIAA
jgi:type I restriction enzyme S subunit